MVRAMSVPYQPSIGRKLIYASKIAVELAEARLGQHDLSAKQWFLLTALWQRDGLTVGEIAAYHQAREPTVSKLVDRMELKGLVRRGPDPNDRRIVRVYMTEKAAALSSLIDFHTEFDEALLCCFSGEEIEQFAAMLERLTDNVVRRIAAAQKTDLD